MPFVEIQLKAKYRKGKPRGNHPADYRGNSGSHKKKHTLLPVGIRKEVRLRRKR